MILAAAILVGGLGTRLRSVISDVPKPLAPVHGEPFLYLLLRALQKSGITDVVLLSGYQSEKIQAACGDGSQFNLNIQYAYEEKLLGTAGALKNAERLLHPFSEFLVLNGDSFCHDAIVKLSKISLAPDQLGSIAVSFVEDAERFGTVKLDDQNHIIAFQEKAVANSGYVNAGVYCFPHRILGEIPSDTVCSLEHEIFPQLIKKNRSSLLATVVDSVFDDIGLPESYQRFLNAK